MLTCLPNGSAFYTISATVSLVFGLLECTWSKYRDCHWALLVPFSFLFHPILYVSRVLYGTLYLGFRYLSKFLARNENSGQKPAEKPKIVPTDSASDVFDEKALSQQNTSRLPMELVILITQHLHHADLINLCRSSKYLRNLFFGTANPSQVAKDLRRFACGGNTTPPLNCAVCAIPICSVRFSFPRTNPYPTTRPLTNLPPPTRTGMQLHDAVPPPQRPAPPPALPPGLHPVLLHEPLHPPAAHPPQQGGAQEARAGVAVAGPRRRRGDGGRRRRRRQRHGLAARGVRRLLCHDAAGEGPGDGEAVWAAGEGGGRERVWVVQEGVGGERGAVVGEGGGGEEGGV